MKVSNLVIGLGIFSVACLTSGNAYAIRIINWERDNGGKHGYRNVSQTYNGTTSPGNDQVYTVVCQNPGNESCRFVGISAPKDVDDYAVNVASQFFDEMNEVIDKESLTNIKGSWSKTIQTEYEGRELMISVSSVWTRSKDGVTRITTTITPMYI